MFYGAPRIRIIFVLPYAAAGEPDLARLAAQRKRIKKISLLIQVETHDNA